MHLYLDVYIYDSIYFYILWADAKRYKCLWKLSKMKHNLTWESNCVEAKSNNTF